MPRLARLDAPGVLHHVLIRGIERRNIFRDNQDRDNLLNRVADLFPATKTSCYAWAFLSNHAHFLFRSGPGGIHLLLGGPGTGVEQHVHCKEAGDESASSGIRCRERGRTGKRARPFSRTIDLLICGRPASHTLLAYMSTKKQRYPPA